MSLVDQLTFLDRDNQAEAEVEPLIPTVVHGPNLSQAKKMSRRAFAQGVLNVYQELGGDAWLLQQATIDPKSFLTFLQKMIPTTMNIDDLTDLSITLVNRYGDKLEIATQAASDDCNPHPHNRSIGPEGRLASGDSQVPNITVQDRFDTGDSHAPTRDRAGGAQSDEDLTVTGNNDGAATLDIHGAATLDIHGTSFEL